MRLRRVGGELDLVLRGRTGKRGEYRVQQPLELTSSRDVSVRPPLESTGEVAGAGAARPLHPLDAPDDRFERDAMDEDELVDGPPQLDRKRRRGDVEDRADGRRGRD